MPLYSPRFLGIWFSGCLTPKLVPNLGIVPYVSPNPISIIKAPVLRFVGGLRKGKLRSWPRTALMSELWGSWEAGSGDHEAIRGAWAEASQCRSCLRSVLPPECCPFERCILGTCYLLYDVLQLCFVLRKLGLSYAGGHQAADSKIKGDFPRHPPWSPRP